MTNNDELSQNPILAYADSYRSMANQGAKSVPVWGVITDIERNIAPLYTALLAEREADKKRIAELESRTVSVKLPDLEKWRTPDGVRAQGAYRRLVANTLSTAGIKLEGGGSEYGY